MKPKGRKSKGEPTIALINVVFLMLIFFLIAGTLAPPLDDDLKLVNTEELEGAPPPEGLVIMSDGTLKSNGKPIENVAAYYAANPTEVVRVVPDRNLPAALLLQIGAALKEAGAEQIVIATEQAVK